MQLFFSHDASATISKKFTIASGQTLVTGMLVCLSSSAPDTVVAATPSNLSSLYGVVTDVTGNSAQVATSEVVQTLVSTANGDIGAGDPVTASGLAGAGEKAIVSTRIVGFAAGLFNSKTPGATQETVSLTNGNKQQVYIGLMPVVLGVSAWQVADVNGDTSNSVPLQKFFDTIAGHAVTPLKVLVSIFVLLVALVIVGVIVGVSARSSLVSIGRNPLASPKLLRGLLQSVGVGVLILIAATAGVYFVVTH
jgi:hypothetical protein